MRHHSRLAFTLVELMVIIVIIALLVAMFLPTFGSVMEVARQSQCVGNLNQISVGLRTLTAATKVAGGTQGQVTGWGGFEVAGWRGQIKPFVSHSTEVMLCPNGKSVGMTEGAEAGGLGEYALRTYGDQGGTNFLYDMPMVEGPSCRKENISNGGRSYDLSFEDQRTSTGDPTGDFSYANPIMSVRFSGTDVTIIVNGGGGGYRWDLIDPKGNILIRNIMKDAGSMQGASVTLGGALMPFSYGLNSVLSKLPESTDRIMGMDYPADVIRLAGADEYRDNWLSENWMGPDGEYTFARHFKKCNVLLVNGAVIRLSPLEMDPTEQAKLAKYWDWRPQ